jgi:PGF-pre-PGF domain-containing protein
VGNKKNQKKSFFASTFITFLIVAMLLFSGPAQAVSVMILGLQDKYTQGSSVKFQVEIDINDVDRFVQIRNVSLDVAGPISKSSTFLLDGTKISGDDNISIDAVSKPNPADFGFGSGFGYDFGYGYGYGNSGYGYGNSGYGYGNSGYGYGNSGYGYGNSGYGYGNSGYGYGYGRGFDFGYGYGYGYGYGGYGYGGGGGKLTYIYNVTVNTSDFPIGSYAVVAHLNTGNSVKPSFDSAPASFKIIAPIQFNIEINPKSINPKDQGKIKVTIFNDKPSGFDVRMINIPSVKFGPNKASAVDNQTTAGNLMLFFNTQDTGIKCGDTQATLTGKTIDGMDIVGVDTFQTVGCISPGGNGGNAGSSGGRTGTGGVSTLEPFENIIKYEIKDCILTAGQPSSCKFAVPEHWISELVITGKESETATFSIEALKGLSPRVNVPAPGTKYLNIWSGSQSIQEALIRFSVDNSWIASEGLTAENLRMYNWDGSRWNELDTRILSKDASATNYEAKTSAFSFFAISGIKGAATPSAISPTLTVTPIVTGTAGKGAAPAPSMNLYLIIGVFIVILAGVVFYFARKK